MNATTSRQEKEDSPYVINGMIKVFTLDVYALLDPSNTLEMLLLRVELNLLNNV